MNNIIELEEPVQLGRKWDQWHSATHIGKDGTYILQSFGTEYYWSDEPVEDGGISSPSGWVSYDEHLKRKRKKILEML